MSKRIVLLTVALFAIAAFTSGLARVACAAELKIAYVDMGKVFSDYNKTKDAEKVMEEKTKVKEGERKTLVDELRKLKDEQALLSEKAKAEKQTIIDEKVKNLQEFDRKARDELIKERNDKLGTLVKDMEKVIEDYAKESGYDFIVDSRILLYGKEQYEVTAEILKRLNK
ncbi:MAG: OmpH family outer membrane protein [Candidatus Omnitrophota bacterium]